MLGGYEKSNKYVYLQYVKEQQQPKHTHYIYNYNIFTTCFHLLTILLIRVINFARVFVHVTNMSFPIEQPTIAFSNS